MALKCYNRRNGKCRAFVGVECKEGCSARITNPDDYAEMLNDLLRNSSDNRSKAALRKELKELKERDGAVTGWKSVYNEDLHRGKGGGSSEGSENAGLKQKMKDNRPVECKWTEAEKKEIKETMDKWETDNGRLPRLKRRI